MKIQILKRLWKQAMYLFAVMLITTAITLTQNIHFPVRLRELVIIDPMVFYHDRIMEKLPSNARVVFLNGDTNGLDQITKILARERDICVLRIFSHGTPGKLYLNGELIDSNTLAKYRRTIHTWTRSMTDGADILLYGCSVAETDEGRAFVNQLAAYTGADVAASTNRTGGLESQWALEYQTGRIEAALLSVKDYPYYLANQIVLNNNDSGAGSLRQAISDVGDGEEITFQLSGGSETITLTSGELIISKNLTIDGDNTGGSGTSITIDGDNSFRVFRVTSGVVTLLNLTAQNGNNSISGGGIYNSATLTIDTCTISGNTVSVSGGDNLGLGGGIYNKGTLTIYNSNVTGNTVITNADSDHDTEFYAFGGGIYNNHSGTIGINTSTISGNTASVTGASNGWGTCYVKGGGICSYGTTTLYNSTVGANDANIDVENTPIYSFGGGVFTNDADVTIINSTISGNTAFSNGGSYGYANGGGIMCLHDSYNLELSNSTVSGNIAEGYMAGLGGGIYSGINATISNCTISTNSLVSDTKMGAGLVTALGTLTIRNTIIAQNTDNASDYDYYNSGATLTDNDYNAVGKNNNAASWNGTNTWLDTDCDGTFTQNTSADTGTLSLSSTLADNGGPTQTLALTGACFAAANQTTGIPPVNNWNNSPLIEGDYTDQRGVVRIPGQNTAIGAYAVNYISTFTWNGIESSDWTDGNNWSTGSAPGATDDVIIPDAATTDNDPDISGAYTVNSFTVQNGGVVQFTSALSRITADDGGISITGTGEGGDGALTASGSSKIQIVAQTDSVTLAGAKISGQADINIESTNTIISITGTTDIITDAATVTLTSGGGDITGGGSLSITTSNTLGYVNIADNINSLSAFTITNAAQVDLENVTTTGNIAVTGMNIDLNGTTYTSSQEGLTFTGAVDLDSNTGAMITSGGGAGDNISFTSTINGKDDNTQSLTLDTGESGTISVSGAIGGSDSKQIKTLTITNSNGATFSNNVTADTSVVLSDTTDSANITFSGALITPTLTTANQGYDVTLYGDGTTIINLLKFLNTGTVSMGNASGDTLTFTSGIETTGNASNPDTVILNGTLATSNNAISFGTAIISGDATVDPAGGAITFGAVTVNDSKTLTVGTGNTGAINFVSTIDSTGGGIGNLTINTDDTATLQSDMGGITPLGTLTLTNGTFDPGTYNIVSGTITVNGGTFGTPGSSGAWDVNHVMIGNSGLMIATTDTFNVSGNWSNTGTFSPGSGTVNFDGSGAQSISGGNSFYNLTISDGTNLTISGADMTVDHILQLNGSGVFVCTDNGIAILKGQVNKDGMVRLSIPGSVGVEIRSSFSLL